MLPKEFRDNFSLSREDKDGKDGTIKPMFSIYFKMNTKTGIIRYGLDEIQIESDYHYVTHSFNYNQVDKIIK